MGEVTRESFTAFSGVQQTTGLEPLPAVNDLAVMQDCDSIMLSGRGHLWMPPAFEDLVTISTVGAGHGEVCPIMDIESIGFHQNLTVANLLPWSWLIILSLDGVDETQVNKLRADGTLNGTEGVGGNTWPLNMLDSTSNHCIFAGHDVDLGFAGWIGHYGSGPYTHARLYTTQANPDAVQATNISTSYGGTFGGGQIAAMHGGRVFQADMATTGYHNRVIFSDLRASDGGSQLETFDSDSWFEIPTESQGPDMRIMHMRSWHSGLLIFTNTEIWLMRGDGPDNFALDKLDSTVGCMSRYGATTYKGDIYFVSMAPGREGIYRLDGSLGTPTCISQVIGREFGVPRPFPNQGAVAGQLWHHFVLEAWEDRLFFIPRGSNFNHKIYVGNLVGEGWQWTFMDQGWQSTDTTGTQLAANTDIYTPFFKVRPAQHVNATPGSTKYEGAALLASDWNKILYTRAGAGRFSGEDPEVTLGWFEAKSPQDIKRWISIKLLMWKEGTGDVPYTLDLTTETGQTVQKTGNVMATASGDSTDWEIHHAIGMRSRLLKLKITFNPSADDQQVLVEGIEIITSSKPSKAGGGDFG